jgi:uncharacterized protein
MKTKEKFNILKHTLREMKRVIIAFSGGVDSTFLLKTATISGLEDILAVTAASESLPERELAFTREMALSLNTPHRIITTDELRDDRYASNPPDRCYYCKKELFSRLREIASEEDSPFILDGSNADDLNDHRPGRRAAEEFDVRSPLSDAGLSKDEIRALSKELALPTWDKPAAPCLSSRFPYGQTITAEALRRVNQAEAFLKKFGFRDLRVRDHDDIARIEVMPGEFSILMEGGARDDIVTYLKSLGYKHVTLDLRGFRSGGFNETINRKGSRIRGFEDSSS